MSVLSEVLANARTVTNELLGNACILTDTLTRTTTDCVVIIQPDTELYQANQFLGVATTGVFDLTACNPLIGNALEDLETGIKYMLDGIKTETATKVVFILREVS